MKKSLLLACALAAALPSAAWANRPGYGFVRVEAGNGRAELDVDGASDSDTDTAYSIRGGYYFSENWAVEGFYTSYYDQKQDDVTLKFNGYGVGAVGKINFGDDDLGWYVGGRAGVVQSKVKFAVENLGGDSAEDLRPYVGVNAGYDFSPNAGIGLSYDYFKAKPEFDGQEIDVTAGTLTLGVEYRF